MGNLATLFVKVAYVVSWLIGAFCVVIGVTALFMPTQASRSYNATMALTLILFGLVIIPPAYRFLSKHIRWLSPWYMRVIVGFMVLVGGAMIATTMPGAPKQTRVAETPSSRQTAPSAQKPDRVDLTGEVKDNWAQISYALRLCDIKAKRVAEAVEKTSDRYALYPLVMEAKESCQTASADVGRLDPPPSARGDARKAFRKALDSCETAYLLKADAYAKMGKVLDGDMRPSAVSEAQDAMKTAVTGQMVCVAGYMSAANDADVPLETFKSE